MRREVGIWEAKQKGNTLKGEQQGVSIGVKGEAATARPPFGL